MYAHFYHFSPKSPAICPKRWSWLLALPALFLLAICCSPPANAVEPVEISLNDIQRRNFLRYYAPLIMKQAYENTTDLKGRDWITNFDFDRDGMFSSNMVHWKDLSAYIRGSNSNYAKWEIRPTVYAALLEFREGNADKPSSKSLVLLYHIYHAMEDGEIHDWERVEIRLNNVNTPTIAGPGGGENVAYVTATQHTKHVSRPLKDIQFMSTALGKHPMILQGPWKNDDDLDLTKNELRHVTTPWATIQAALTECGVAGATCKKATVNVTDGNGTEKNPQQVNYVFVPGGDPLAAATLGALNLTKSMAAQTTKVVDWNHVIRITYELQDIADLTQTHAKVEACGSFPTEHDWKYHPDHWIGASVEIKMDNKVHAEPGNPGATLVPTSADCGGKKITYYLNANDDGDVDTKAQSYPNKHWFWGAYMTGVEEGSYTDKAFGGTPFYTTGKRDDKGSVRYCADGIKNKYWCQHDYYAHLGQQGSRSNGKLIEPGAWLIEGWYTKEKFGFDGRWVQLFSDKYDIPSPPPPPVRPVRR